MAVINSWYEGGLLVGPQRCTHGGAGVASAGLFVAFAVRMENKVGITDAALGGILSVYIGVSLGGRFANGVGVNAPL